ncbi:MAG: hypothetical protein KDD10_16150 [Phaeodactylibacter sp.]|nr:hypothetical protein [Phaeodactylibacter sp.]MCB9292470.1 hypothetical protein [Lewinellaceae bacterium]
MKMLFPFLTLLCSAISLLSQPAGFADPDSILAGGRPLPRVLLVGTWHFDYPGLDAHVTSEEHKMNIFSEKRQRELAELLDYIARFQPNKIAVEGGRNSGYLIRRYERWQDGTQPLGASEIDQIAIRLMDRFGLDTLYGVDDWSLINEYSSQRDTAQPPSYIDSLWLGFTFDGQDEASLRYKAFYQYKDSMTVEHSLLENFLYINSDKVLERGFGAYLAGHFKSDGQRGPDMLSIFWFNRNLRIFRNLQRITTGPEDRIMVLFGAGHIQILKWLFECSPEYELVEFGSLKP